MEDEKGKEMKKIPLARPSLGDEELAAVKRVFESGMLSEHSVTKEFEAAFAEYVGAKHAIASSSCSTALDLALLSLELSPRDEVIVPDFTFPATANSVLHAGAGVVLVDIEARTFNIDPREIEKNLSKRTKAIVPVHLFGQCANMKVITEIAEKHGLFVVEDAACAIGATHHGKKAGTFGDIACFSFHPRKTLAVGEGGMVVTNDDELAEKVRVMKNHGIAKMVGNRACFVKPGYNFRLNDVASAIGLEQLKKVKAFLKERAKLAGKYDDALGDVRGVETPFVAKDNNHTYQTYCVTVESEKVRDRLIEGLAVKGVETQIGTYTLSLQPVYAETGKNGKAKLSVSEKTFRSTLALPMYNGLSEEEQEYVCENLAALL